MWQTQLSSAKWGFRSALNEIKRDECTPFDIGCTILELLLHRGCRVAILQSILIQVTRIKSVY